MSINPKIIFSIVTFREEFWKCNSFIALVNSYKNNHKGEKLTVYIFDNTDLPDWFSTHPFRDDQIEIIYRRDQSNPGISFAYNTVAEYAKDHQFTYIVFLDQDSTLCGSAYADYINISTKEIDAAIPKVFSGQSLISPHAYKLYRSFIYKNIPFEKIPLKGNSFINSGLIIKTSVFFKASGYNTNLRLDFCDHDFVQRLSTVINHVNLLPFELKQDFSAQTNTLEQALFRYKLFEKDLSSFKVNRNKLMIILFVEIPHLLQLTAKYRTTEFLKMKFSS